MARKKVTVNENDAQNTPEAEKTSGSNPTAPAQPVQSSDTVPPAPRAETRQVDQPDPLVETDFDEVDRDRRVKSDLLSVEEVTHQVLGGRWGATAALSMQNLEEAGYDVDAVWAEFTRRKAGGAPSAF